MTRTDMLLILTGLLTGVIACSDETAECQQTQAMASLPPYCRQCNGNGQCDSGESCQSCPQDCGNCAAAVHWRPVASPTDVDLRAVRGSEAGNVWAVGEKGVALRYSNGSWERVSTTITEDLWDVWTDGPSNVWVVGAGETVLQWTGSGWTKVEEPTGFKDSTGNPPLLSSISGAAADDLWITPAHPLQMKDGGLVEGTMHLAGSEWFWYPRSTCTTCITVRVSAAAASKVWVIRDGGPPQQWDGSSWTEVTLPVTGGPPAFFGLWASPASVWLAGESPSESSGVILQSSGNSWHLHDGMIEKNHRCRGIWGTGGEAWLVCLGGAILHYDGAKWSVEQSSGKSLLAVWGSALDDIWAVGAAGTLLHRSP